MVNLSVIVPIYNKEKTLYRCIESLERQTLKNIEIILINDGSTDNTEKICLKFQERFPEKIKYFYKNNGGCSQARNLGILKAKGKYIGFVDSDDYVEKDMYKTLFQKIEEEKYDILGCGFQELNEKDEIISYCSVSKLAKKNLKISEFILENNMFGYVCNKIFKREIVSKYNISFPEGIHLFEDAVFVFKYSIFAKRIGYIDYCPYKYIKYNDLSQVTSSYLEKIDSLYESVEGFENICLFLEKYKKLDLFSIEIDNYFEKRVVRVGYAILKNNISKINYKKEKERYYNIINKYLKYLSFRSKNTVLIRKTLLFLLEFKEKKKQFRCLKGEK